MKRMSQKCSLPLRPTPGERAQQEKTRTKLSLLSEALSATKAHWRSSGLSTTICPIGDCTVGTMTLRGSTTKSLGQLGAGLPGTGSTPSVSREELARVLPDKNDWEVRALGSEGYRGILVLQLLTSSSPKLQHPTEWSDASSSSDIRAAHLSGENSLAVLLNLPMGMQLLL